jgi:histidinol-phosphate aminotransferase
LPPALADQEYVRGYVDQVLRGRNRLTAALRDAGVRHWPSRANFVLAYFGDRREVFIRGMRSRGILVRDRNSDPGCRGCVRITVGTDEQTERLLSALNDVLAEL